MYKQVVKILLKFKELKKFLISHIPRHVERVKKKYKCLPFSTKRQGIMYDGKRKAYQFERKERKKKSPMKSQRFCVRLFNAYFLIKNLMKSIKIHLKKESIQICILLNMKRLFF